MLKLIIARNIKNPKKTMMKRENTVTHIYKLSEFKKTLITLLITSKREKCSESHHSFFNKNTSSNCYFV